jgi:hypothetical protein
MMERIRQAMTEVSFTRGLALGALAGAAIAGSTLWSRLRGGRRDGRHDVTSVTADPAGRQQGHGGR